MEYDDTADTTQLEEYAHVDDENIDTDGSSVPGRYVRAPVEVCYKFMFLSILMNVVDQPSR